MKVLSSCCLTAIAACCALTAFACETPATVTVPDGKTATMDQMLDAQGKVKAYIAQMDEYLACTNEELEAAGEEAPAEFKSLMITRHNNAVDEMEAVADAFNEALRAYKAAHPN